MRIKYRHPTERLLIFILLIIIGLMSAILWSFGQRLNILDDQTNGTGSLAHQQETGLGWFPIKIYIQNAERGFYSLEPVADPSKNVVYLPEARISLPLSAESRDLRYNYEARSSGSPAQVLVSTTQILNKSISNFADVTCEQRVIGFSIDQKDGFTAGGKYAGSISLSDGRILYFWLNDTKFCQNFWGDGTQSDILGVLKQAQSY